MSGLYGKSRKYRGYTHHKHSWFHPWKIVFFLVIFCAGFNLISLLLVTAWQTPSGAMEPVLPAGSRFLSTSLVLGRDVPLFNFKLKGFRVPERGDVVIIKPPFIEDAPWYLSLTDGFIRFFTLQKVTINSSRKKYWENPVLVKRIIGIPGDTIKAKSYQISIKPAGEPDFVSESAYIPGEAVTLPRFPDNWDPEHPFSGNLAPLLLGDGEYFVLSDNRGRGTDSLVWGQVDRSRIAGLVFFRYWPDPGFHF